MGQIQSTVNQALGIAAAGASVVKAGQKSISSEASKDIQSQIKKGIIPANVRQAYGKQIGKKNQFARKTFDEDIMKKAIQNVSSEIAAKKTIRERFTAGINQLYGFVGGKE